MSDEDVGRQGREPDAQQLVPQPHGGALTPPFQPGHAGAGGFRKPRRQALQLLHDGVVAASQRLLSLVNSSDERVAVMASIQILDRVLGKPTNDVPHDASNGLLDLSVLNAPEHEELATHLAGIRRVRDLVSSRMNLRTGRHAVLLGCGAPAADRPLRRAPWKTGSEAR